jgi:hypothetical protein
VDSRVPSGLFPSGSLRPTFREPHRARVSMAFASGGVAAAWLVLVGLLASSARSYAWLTIGASALSGLVAVALARLGDRGAAVGVAIATAFGLAIAMGLVTERWITTGWPLW